MNVPGGLESAILCLARLLRVKTDFVYPQIANLMLNVHLLGMSAHQEDFQVIHFIISRIQQITKTKSIHFSKVLFFDWLVLQNQIDYCTVRQARKKKNTYIFEKFWLISKEWMNLIGTYYKPTIYVLHTPILFFSGSCNVTGDSCEYNPVLSIAICGK